GASAAAAVLLTPLPAIRTTPVTGAPRLPYCMMGACFDCLAVIDGIANRQACMVPVSPGMRIDPQHGARQARSGVA
ncbi:MAG: 2Fe-2S iron-sulfur cluster-binding protein, partial [Janthinobacterium lividum]